MRHGGLLARPARGPEGLVVVVPLDQEGRGVAERRRVVALDAPDVDPARAFPQRGVDRGGQQARPAASGVHRRGDQLVEERAELGGDEEPEGRRWKQQRCEGEGLASHHGRLSRELEKARRVESATVVVRVAACGFQSLSELDVGRELFDGFLPRDDLLAFGATGQPTAQRRFAEHRMTRIDALTERVRADQVDVVGVGMAWRCLAGARELREPPGQAQLVARAAERGHAARARAEPRQLQRRGKRPG